MVLGHLIVNTSITTAFVVESSPLKPQLINALEYGLRGIKDSIVVGETSQIMVEQRAELVIATECLTLGMTVHVINVMPHGC